MPELRKPSYPPLHTSRKNPRSSTTSSASRMSLCDSNLPIHLYPSRKTRRMLALMMVNTSLSSTSCSMTTTTTSITTGTKTTLLMLTSTLYEYLDDPSLTLPVSRCVLLSTLNISDCMSAPVSPRPRFLPQIFMPYTDKWSRTSPLKLPSRTSAVSASSGSSPSPSAYFYRVLSQAVLAMHSISV